MCRLMIAINDNFSHLQEEKKERIRSIVCGDSCGGSCKDIYSDKTSSKFENKKPPQPKGIYKIINDEGLQIFGRIENMSCSKLFIWNEVNENFYIIKFDDVVSMRPIKKYPNWIYAPSK